MGGIISGKDGKYEDCMKTAIVAFIFWLRMDQLSVFSCPVEWASLYDLGKQ